MFVPDMRGPRGNAGPRRAAQCAIASRRLAASVGSLTLLTRPSFSKNRMMYHVMSNCRLPSPWRAEYSKAWWLLCQPSPKASQPTHQLLRDWSPVA